MTRLYRSLCCCFALLLLALPLQATHMVGGEINYRCLGNNQYEITLTVFRDCDTGVPWFDNPAAVGVFDSSNALVYDLRIPLSSINDTLDLSLSDPCLVVPPNVCIHTTTYTDTVSLPFLAGGYQLVYQRCCRNQDIVNIVNPLGTGATYSNFVSEEALLSCNSSAVFREWPPVYICAGQPINFDHSAIDIDGDSIVYELCTPLTGASPLNSRPQPPNTPPYANVTWQTPYNVNNMMGGSNPLSIDPQTGLLTGTPFTLGVFVVGVCASEYRNGQLISTTRRDFQYAVGVCGQQVSSAFFAPDIQCDNSLTVSFQNNSNATVGNYFWDFGDLNTAGDTSLLENPVYIFPDTGRYTVTLVADPNSRCADTTTQEIYLQYESILTDFETQITTCSDTLELQVTDLTVDTISNITNWSWNFGNGDTASTPFPTTQYSLPGFYIISLEVEAANGCRGQHFDTLQLNIPFQSSPDTVALCGPDSVQLNPIALNNPAYQYQWAPSTGLSDPQSSSPWARPSSSTWYTVTITAANGSDTCVLQDSVFVGISPGVNLTLPPDTSLCASSVLLVAQSSPGTSIEWAANQANFQSPISIQSSFLAPLNMSTRFYARAVDALGCADTSFVDVYRVNVPINAQFSYSSLSCDSALTVQFSDLTTDTSQGPIIAWGWDFGNGTGSSLQNPINTYNSSGNYSITFQAISAQGCVGTATQNLNISLPQINSTDTVGICPGSSSVQLNVGGNPSFDYQWAPASSLNSATAVSPVASPSSPTTYTVTVTSYNGIDTCTAIRQVHVNFPPPVSVTVPPSTVYCGNTVTLTANSPTGVFFEWAGDPSFFTVLGTGNPATLTPITTPFSAFYVRATDAYGCSNTAFALVEQRSAPIAVDFIYQSTGCGSAMNVQFNDITADTTDASIVSWDWSTSDGQSDTVPNPSFVFQQSGSIFVTLTVTLANGCTGSETKIIQLDLPTYNGLDTVGICAGTTSIQLNPNGNPNLQYQWSPAAGLSSTTAASPIANPTSPTTYSVTMTGLNSLDTCVATYDISIVFPPPVTLSIINDSTFCANSITMEATGQYTSLDWSFTPSFNAPFLSDVNSFGLSFPAIGTYNVYARASDNYGCEVFDNASLTFSNQPVPVSFSYSLPNCPTDTAFVPFTGQATASGSNISDWAWDFGNGQTSVQPNGTAAYNADSNYIVSLQVTLDNGCTGQFIDSLDLQFNRLTSSDTVGICNPGDSLVLNPNGNPNAQYQWAPTTGLSSSTAASPMVTVQNSTLYTVTISSNSDLGSCQRVDSVFVGVSSLNLQMMDDTVVCQSQLQLSANAPTAVRFDWALDANFQLPLGTGNPFAVNAVSSRWFYLRVEDIYGCTQMDSVWVEVRNQPLPADFGISPLACSDSLQVLFVDQSPNLPGSSIVQWSWDLGNGQSSTLQNPGASYTQAGNYPVSLEIRASNGCIGKIEDTLNILLPTPQLAMDSLILCAGDTLALNPSPNPDLNYLWSPATGLSDPNSPNPLVFSNDSRLYTLDVAVLNVFGDSSINCLAQEQIWVEVPPALSSSLQGPSSSCEAAILLSSNPPSAATITWSLDPNFSSSLSNNSNLNFNLSEDTRFYWRVEDAFGCRREDSLLTLYQGIEAMLDSGAVVCAQEPVQLQVDNLRPADSLQYFWTPSAEILTGQGTNSVTVAPATAQSFNVFLENQYQCRDTLSSFVQVSNALPPLVIRAERDSFFQGQSVQLEATFNPNYNYFWETNPSLSAWDIFNPIAQPEGDQWYYLEIEDELGCRNQDSILLRQVPFICDEPFVFVPNAFTPNGDGQNDLLFVRSSVVTDVFFVVYNRWGEPVFESNSLDRGWDGRFRGKELPPDVYGYLLRVRCLGGQELRKKGNVTLIR